MQHLGMSAERRSAIEEQLRLVDEAISARLRGIGHIEATSGNGQSFQYTSLQELRSMQRELTDELQRIRGPISLRPSLPRRWGR